MSYEMIVCAMALGFGICTFIAIKKKRFRLYPLVCTAMLLAFIGFTAMSYFALFAPNSDIELLLFGGSFGVFWFLLGVNDLYFVIGCNKEIKAVYCGFNAYPGNRGVTIYSPVFEYGIDGTVYHEQTTQNVPYGMLKNMIQGESYFIYINPKRPGMYVLRRKIGYTTVILFFFAIAFPMIAIGWLWL